MDRPAGPQFRLDGGQRGGSMTIGARSRGASPVVCASQQLVGKGGDSAVNSRQRPRHLALPEHRARFGLTAEPQARAVVVFDATEVALVGFESRGARGVTVTVARAVGTLGRVGRYAILPLGRCGDGLQRQQRQRGALHYGAIWIYLQPRGLPRSLRRVEPSGSGRCDVSSCRRCMRRLTLVRVAPAIPGAARPSSRASNRIRRFSDVGAPREPR
jgi:hypothetical protein